MTKISKEEVLKIAHISHLDVHEDEIQPLIQQLEAVLSYAERVQKLADETVEPSHKNINVFREDVVVRSDADAVLARAPQQEERYFVVPAIIEK